MKDQSAINLLLVTKNALLPELISNFNYEVDWYNGDLTGLSQIDADIVVYDSFSYGIKPLEEKKWQHRALIILDVYNQQLFIDNLISDNNRAYLLIDDFLGELPTAIEQLLGGANYLTSKLSCELNH